jgi:hypothetical protein
MPRENWKKEKHNENPKGSPGRTFFSKLTSTEYFFTVTLRQSNKHEPSQAPQAYRRNLWNPKQQHLPQ